MCIDLDDRLGYPAQPRLIVLSFHPSIYTYQQISHSVETGIGPIIAKIGPTRKLSKLRETMLALVVEIAVVGVMDPPPPPSGEFLPDLDQKDEWQEGKRT